MRHPLPLAILFLTAACLCQCAHVVQTREDYALGEEGPSLNGARVTAELLTTDGRLKYALSAMVYFAAGETETGPYKCLLTAWGDREVHQSMTVHRLTFRTDSGQTATAPPSGPHAFAPGAGDRGWQATYVVPGVLDLDYKKDGDLTLDASLTIQSHRRKIRKDVQLVFSPSQSRNIEFATIFDEFERESEDAQGAEESEVWQ